MSDLAQKDIALVPIRLEIDSDGHKLRDTFTWNLYGIFIRLSNLFFKARPAILFFLLLPNADTNFA